MAKGLRACSLRMFLFLPYIPFCFSKNLKSTFSFISLHTFSYFSIKILFIPKKLDFQQGLIVTYLYVYRYDTILKEYSSKELSFQSHQVRILSAGLGTAHNRDGLSCIYNYYYYYYRWWRGEDTFYQTVSWAEKRIWAKSDLVTLTKELKRNVNTWMNRNEKKKSKNCHT